MAGHRLAPCRPESGRPRYARHGGPRRTGTRAGRQAAPELAHERCGDARTAQVQLEQQHALAGLHERGGEAEGERGLALVRNRRGHLDHLRRTVVLRLNERELERAQALRVGGERALQQVLVRPCSGPPSRAAGAGRPRGNGTPQRASSWLALRTPRPNCSTRRASSAPDREEPVNPNIEKRSRSRMRCRCPRRAAACVTGRHVTHLSASGCRATPASTIGYKPMQVSARNRAQAVPMRAAQFRGSIEQVLLRLKQIL